jgi:hypothetical protein
MPYYLLNVKLFTDKLLVVQKLLQDREFIEDLMDIALIEQWRSEPARPLEEYLAEQGK